MSVSHYIAEKLLKVTINTPLPHIPYFSTNVLQYVYSLSLIIVEIVVLLFIHQWIECFWKIRNQISNQKHTHTLVVALDLWLKEMLKTGFIVTWNTKYVLWCLDMWNIRFISWRNCGISLPPNNKHT